MTDLDQSPTPPYQYTAEGPTDGWVKDYSPGGSASPGGNPLDIQYNNFGVFAGLTDIQLTARIQMFTSTLPGAVPASGGSPANFLCADGTFKAPPSGGGGLPDGDKGDITVTGSGTVWTIDPGVVTYAKMQNVSTSARLLGRISVGSGSIEELVGTQVTSLLDIFSSGSKGLVSASGGGTANFLRADGSWVTPGTSGGTQRSVTSGPISVLSGDSILNINIASPQTINLPAASTRAGRAVTFKDVGAHATANHITIVANGAETIDGSTSIVMAFNGQSVTITPFNDGVNTGWFIT